MLATNAPSASLTAFAAEWADKHNDICYWWGGLVRLVGVFEDEDGLYYRAIELGGKRINPSDILRFSSIKSRVSAEEYATIDRLFAVNQAGPTETFRVDFYPGQGIDLDAVGTPVANQEVGANQEALEAVGGFLEKFLDQIEATDDRSDD